MYLASDQLERGRLSAMAMAITAFKNDEVGRIILTRPAIEAGEKLGFFPEICRAR